MVDRLVEDRAIEELLDDKDPLDVLNVDIVDTQIDKEPIKKIKLNMTKKNNSSTSNMQEESQCTNSKPIKGNSLNISQNKSLFTNETLANNHEESSTKKGSKRTTTVGKDFILWANDDKSPSRRS